MFVTFNFLESKLPFIAESPKNNGTLDLITRRPDFNLRENLLNATLSIENGLVGDSWKKRGNFKNPNLSADLNAQITIMNIRVISLIAQIPEKRNLAGDQLYVDFDLSFENLKPNNKLQIGEAIVQISETPHNGCQKFSQRFGHDALKFVNFKKYRHLNLRGLNAKVVKEGQIKVGDKVILLN